MSGKDSSGTNISHGSSMGPNPPLSRRMRLWQWCRTSVILVAAVAVASVLIWQGITAGGNPDPTIPHTTFPVAALDIAVLVQREGLESILVLAAIIGGLQGARHGYQRPIQFGIVMGLMATLLTWFAAISVVSDLTMDYGALNVQAATGLFAVIILLIVMNWFFHNVYWSGWISMQNRRKMTLIAQADKPDRNSRRVALGLGVLGFASVFREGVEVVIFLQSFRLQMGDLVVYYGAAGGLVLTAAVGYLTFVGQRRLPYKRMLVATGILLTGVLFVMVGEQVNEMQLAGWIGTTNIPWLQGIPDWAGLWFSIFPNVETFAIQAFALLLVAGSYFARSMRWRSIFHRATSTTLWMHHNVKT